MTILIVLVFATMVIYGWFRASVLAAIFLTLGEIMGMGFIGAFRPDNDNLNLQRLNLVLIVLIWLPVAIRLCRRPPAPVVRPPARAPLTLTIRSD
jgi:hypothetical protein